MTQPKPGDPVWIDLFTADPERSIAFYTDLFGWTAERGGPEFGGYITFRKNGKAVAGGMAKQPDSPEGPDQWTVYLSSTDARATAAAAADKGGAICVAPMPVGDLGVMAILGDPGNSGVGVWQAGSFAGIETNALVEDGKWRDHDGAPSWFELHTHAYDAALDFYRDVFGWNDTFAVPMPEEAGFRYSTIHSTSPMRGGVMDASVLPPDAPGGWTVYFGADDVDKAVAKVVELGGTVLSPPQDTPYGRMAAVTDSTGARFSLGGDVG
ncbi:VOC family protein [Nocardia arizonensis]|uniref:VOC family protein n=1 Tax=Nocardia arizonensis TaxID=1141647 RepID=UPI0006CF7CA3|nr:VOC family protein [Nocardia arizonensis]